MAMLVRTMSRHEPRCIVAGCYRAADALWEYRPHPPLCSRCYLDRAGCYSTEAQLDAIAKRIMTENMDGD